MLADGVCIKKSRLYVKCNLTFNQLTLYITTILYRKSPVNRITQYYTLGLIAKDYSKNVLP